MSRVASRWRDRALRAHHQTPPVQSSVPTLTKKKAALLMDISKFEELIERLEKHKEDQTRRLDAKHADIAAKRTSVCRRLVCCLASAHRVTCNGVVCV